MNIFDDNSFSERPVEPVRHVWVLLLVAVLLAVVYGRILDHEFLLNWDDNLYVTDNNAIRGFSLSHLKSAFTSFYVGNYAPLQIVSYMADYTFWGLRPAGYLLTNLIIHGLNGFLLYLLVYRISGLFPAALGSALLFLVHPAQVETVAWISQRKNLLSMAFYLLGALAYVIYRQESGERKRFYWLSVVAFSAALLTKSVAVIFPVMLVIYDICYTKRTLAQSLPDKVPFVVIASGAAFLTLLTQSVEYGGGGRTSFHGGSAYTTLLTMLPVFVSYLRIIVWPSGLSAVYAPDIKKTPDMEVVTSALFLLLMVCYAIYLYRRDRREFFWLSLVPLGLLPVAQIVPLITLMNDRYLYYPMIGVAPFIALGIFRFLQGNTLWVRRFACLVSVAILAIMAIVANQRTKVWHNAATLWGDAVSKVPGSPTAKNSLAEAYFKTGRYAEAKPLLFDLIRDYPGNPAPYEMLGNIFYETGDSVNAREYYLKALAIKSDLPMANLCLGNIYLAQKEFMLARMKFLEAEKLKPDSPDIAYSLACAESMLGHNEAALDYLEKAFGKGFKGCQALEMNPELDPVRGLPAYNNIITKFCGQMRSK